MKTHDSQRKQGGFFDLGFSLVLLAIFSTVAVVTTDINAESPEQIASCVDDHKSIKNSNTCGI